MSFFSKIKWFQKVASAVLIIFMGIMAAVIIAAYSRRSGNTGLDMSKMQKMRTEANGSAKVISQR